MVLIFRQSTTFLSELKRNVVQWRWAQFHTPDPSRDIVRAIPHSATTKNERISQQSKQIDPPKWADNVCPKRQTTKGHQQSTTFRRYLISCETRTCKFHPCSCSIRGAIVLESLQANRTRLTKLTVGIFGDSGTLRLWLIASTHTHTETHTHEYIYGHTHSRTRSRHRRRASRRPREKQRNMSTFGFRGRQTKEQNPNPSPVGDFVSSQCASQTKGANVLVCSDCTASQSPQQSLPSSLPFSLSSFLC